MAKRRFSITATEDDEIPVLAAFDHKAGPPKKTYLAMLACDGCNTKIVGPNSSEPFCPCCANTMHATSDKTLLQTKNDVEKMDTIGVCKECDTEIAMPSDIEASLHDNAIYCPTCSAEIKVEADNSDDSEDSDTEESEDMSDTVEDTDTGDDNSEDDSGEDNLFDNNSEDDTDTTDEATDDTTDTAAEDTNTDNTDSTSTDDSSLQANLVKYLSGKSGSISIVASPDSSKYFLFVDNYPVAVSEKERASDNVQSMFGTDKFATSWGAATTDGVTQDVLNDFGFQATTVSVPVDEAVKQTVEAAIDVEKNKYTKLTASNRSRLERCITISAMGINKNVFKEENPVKTALIASMKGVRVRDAERIVNDIFNKHGEDMFANVIMKATELMDKTDETLDELSNTVEEAKYSKEPVSETETTPKKASSVITFPAKAEEVIVEEEEVKEMAASDEVVDDMFERMSRRLRFKS